MSLPLFDAPNLDDLSIDPADLDAASEVLSQLALYAQWKAMTMRWRLKGRVEWACNLEKEMEALYRSMPEWARW